MENVRRLEAAADWTSDAPTSSSGNPAQPPTTHRTTQRPKLPQSELQVQRAEPQIDADLIESIMTDPRVRIDLLLDESEYPALPLSRKVFREAVACGLLRLVRDDAGRVVKIENGHPLQVQGLPIEAFDEVFYPVTGGNGSGDSEVNWAGIFSNRIDGTFVYGPGQTRRHYKGGSGAVQRSIE